MQGLKAVEAVAKKLDKIEDVQETHEQRLSTHDEAIQKNTQKKEDDEKRIRRLEEKMQNIDQNTIDIRQCNIVAKEVREMERRERNIVIFNVPESREEGEEDAKRLDMVKTQGILKELGLMRFNPQMFRGQENRVNFRNRP